MPKKTPHRKATPNYFSITYWRKMAVHRIFFLGIAVLFAVSAIVYFASPPGMGGMNSGSGATTAIAIVNGEAITQEEYQSGWEAEQRRMRMFSRGADMGAVATAQQQGYLLIQRVRAAVMRAEAKRRGLSVSDEDVDVKIAEIKKQFGRDGKPIPESEWEGIVKEQAGSDAAFREQMKSDLLPEKLQESFASKEKVSEADLQMTYDEIKVRRILIPITSGIRPIAGSLPEAQAKQRAEKLIGELKGGADFAKTADEFSKDPSNQQSVLDPKSKKQVTRKSGGLINAASVQDPGWYRRGGGQGTEFDDAAFKLTQGQLSDVLKTPEGFQIVKVEGSRRKLPDDYAKTKGELLKNLRLTRASKPFQETIEAELKKAKIEWRDPRMQWRYDFASAPGMMTPMGDPQAKGEDAVLQRLRAFTAKDKDDSAANLVLGQSLDQRLAVSEMKPNSLSTEEKKKLELEVIAAYEQALDRTEDRSARFRLGALYKQRKETDKAIAQYEKLMRLMSYDTDLNVRFSYEQLAKSFKELGRADLQVAALDRFAELTKKAEDQRKKDEEQRKKDEAARKAEAEKQKAAVKPGASAASTKAAPGGEIEVKPGGSATITPEPPKPGSSNGSVPKKP